MGLTKIQAITDSGWNDMIKLRWNKQSKRFKGILPENSQDVLILEVHDSGTDFKTTTHKVRFVDGYFYDRKGNRFSGASLSEKFQNQESICGWVPV